MKTTLSGIHLPLALPATYLLEQKKMHCYAKIESHILPPPVFIMFCTEILYQP